MRSFGINLIAQPFVYRSLFQSTYFKKIIPFLNMFDTSNDSEIISISLTIINKILDEKNEYFEIFDS